MDNMKIYNAICTPPNDALKEIKFGALKGMSDINPQWRYEALTNILGPCGVGWKFTIDEYWMQPIAQTGELMVFVKVSLYIKDGDVWSEAIPGYGGDYLIKKDKNGIHGQDEAMKMAVTDALGTAAKMVGAAADVYRGLIANGTTDSKYTRYVENAQNNAQAKKKEVEGKPIATNPKKETGQNDAVRAQAMNRLNAVIKGKGLGRPFLVANAEKIIGKKATEDMTAEEIIKLAEALEAEK